jgi:hypothetical protein
MTDLSDDAEPDRDATVPAVPSGSPPPTGSAPPMGSAPPTVAHRDGGVARRLTTRCRIAAAVLLVVAGCGLLIGLLTDATVSTLLFAIAAGAVLWAAVLVRRAGLWSSIAGSVLPSTLGAEAVVGPTKRLSPGIPGAPVKRRLGASVVPIHAQVDPQPGGGALVVHARADGLELIAGDHVQVWPATRGGLGLAASASASASAGVRRSAPGARGPETKIASGRWVLVRATDGVVFLATTRVSDTW